MTDEERDRLTVAGMAMLELAVQEMTAVGIPTSGQFAMLLSQAAHIWQEEHGHDIERLTAITLRCFSTLTAPRKP